jgi:hypothetical protein
MVMMVAPTLLHISKGANMKNRIIDRARAIARRNPIDIPEPTLGDVTLGIVISLGITAFVFAMLSMFGELVVKGS